MPLIHSPHYGNAFDVAIVKAVEAKVGNSKHELNVIVLHLIAEACRSGQG